MTNSGFSKYDRAVTIQSIYCYPGTDILINKVNIRDEKELKEFETQVTELRLVALDDEPLQGRFGITHLKNIHHFIFQDVYPFAGKFRLEDIWKGDTFFCKSEYIEENLKSLFYKLKGEVFLRGLNAEEFAARASFYMSEMNLIHPFFFSSNQ